MKATKGDWVQIHNIVLQKEQRAPQVPDDTKQVPLEMWVKGVISQDGEIGQQVQIETVTGRKVTGKLVDIYPSYQFGYGKSVPQLLYIGRQVREILQGGEGNE
jgi:2-amino-4-ketopentanoate thiolase alpha subunit